MLSVDHYTAGASGALLGYMESTHKTIFAKGGLTVDKVSLDTYMALSSACAASLELIAPLPGGSSTQSRKELTLFRWLNRTKTKAGARQVPLI